MRSITKTVHPLDPRTPDKREIGEFRIRDIPEVIDEVMRIWITDYNKKMNRFFFLRPYVERLFLHHRFITFEEYETLFNDSITKGIKTHFPIGTSNVIQEVWIRNPG